MKDIDPLLIHSLKTHIHMLEEEREKDRLALAAAGQRIQQLEAEIVTLKDQMHAER